MPKKQPKTFEEAVKTIIKLLAKKSVFGIYTEEDIAQEIWIMCLDAINRYDDTRNLYNFLLTHVKNRLKTLKRDKFFRYECPCKLCSFKDNGQTDHPDGLHCKQYKTWLETNIRKSNIAAPISADFAVLSFTAGGSHEDAVDAQELLTYIEANIPFELRDAYLRLKSGTQISNVEKQQVLDFLKTLVGDQFVDGV